MQPAIEKGHKVDIFPNRTSINEIMRDETLWLLRNNAGPAIQGT